MAHFDSDSDSDSRLASRLDSRAVHLLQSLAALAAAPLAWIVQICTCEALASQACFPAQDPLAHSRIAGLSTLVAVLSVVCFTVAVGGMAAGWRGWQHTRRADESNPDASSARFIFLVSILSTPIFIIGLLVTAMAALIVDPCRPW